MVRYDNIDGQDVNIIDPAAIKAEVAAAIGAAPPTTTLTTTTVKPNPSTVVDVVNSGSLGGLATQVSSALKKHGFTMGQVRDRNAGEPSATTIQYGAGAETDATNVATLLGIDAPAQPDSSIEPGHIRVTVDTNYSLPAPEDSTTDNQHHVDQAEHVLQRLHHHDLPDARSRKADRRRRRALRELRAGPTCVERGRLSAVNRPELVAQAPNSAAPGEAGRHHRP